MTPIEQEVQTLRITKTEVIAASPEIVWESLLHELGPDSTLNPDMKMNFVLEAFPGGRWYRDLGKGVGHLWGHVQVIKPNKVLEICGPMFMSYAATSHVQYKLVPDGDKTRLELVHTAFGLIPSDVATGVQDGWGQQLKVVRERAERSTR
jgi:uncharacterized protein YndB with AHSA1/START domain